MFRFTFFIFYLFMSLNIYANYNWPRYPTDSEIEKAVSDYLNKENRKTNRVGYDYHIVKYHDKELAKSQTTEWGMHSRALLVIEEVYEEFGRRFSRLNTYTLTHGRFETSWNVYTDDARFQFSQTTIFDNNSPYYLKSYTSLNELHRDILNYINSKDHLELGFANRSQSQSSSTPTDNQTTDNTDDFSISDDDDDDIPWTLVVGGLTAAGVAAIVSRLRKKRKQKNQKKENKDDKDKDKEEDAHYVLQINQEEFKLDIGQQQTLDIQVWKITEKGKTAADASINLRNPHNQLKITAQTTSSSMKASLLLEELPPELVFQLTVSATADGKTYEKNIGIQCGGQYRVVATTEPHNKRVLRPDAFQIIKVYPKVINKDGKEVPELTEQLVFHPRSEWMDLSEPFWEQDRLAIFVGAANPYPGYSGSAMPSEMVLSMYLDKETSNVQAQALNLSIQLIECELHLSIRDYSFSTAKEKQEVEFDVHVTNAIDDKPWNFSARYLRAKSSTSPLSEINITHISESHVKVKLTGPLELPEGNDRYIEKDLHIYAAQGEEKPLEDKLQIFVFRSGLVIQHGLDRNGELSFVADGPYERNVDFSLTVTDSQTGEVKATTQGLDQLTFELHNAIPEMQNLASVLKPKFTFVKVYGVNSPLGRYLFSTEEEIPGFGNHHMLEYIVRAPIPEGENPEAFEQVIQLKVITYGIGENNPEWVEACRQVELILENHVPRNSNAYGRLWDLYENRKYILGAEGLIEMRNQIWGIAQNLILAEGAKGYESMERWANAITITLEWTEWAGDIAFKALMAFKAPHLSMPVGIGKSVFMDALKFYLYESDKPISVFFQRQLSGVWDLLIGATKGRIISVKTIQDVLGVNKAVAYGAYIAMNFAYNLLVNKMTVWDAAKATIRQVSEEMLINFLVGKLKEEAMGHNRKVVEVHEALEEVVKEIEGEVEGQESLNQKKLLQIMRDEQLTRTIKDHGPPWLKKIYNDSKQKIYDRHDSMLKSEVARKYHIKESDLYVDDFRTPGSDPNNVNTDRDYRLMRKMKASDGTVYGIEISTSNWKSMSESIFSTITKKPAGSITDYEWANAHKQTPTDRFHAEASVDFSDQVFENGRWTQGKCNIQRVLDGKTMLIDPKGLGKMYENKVAHETNPSEKFAQAKKGVTTFKKVRVQYSKKGLPLDKMPREFLEAMHIVEKAPTNVTATPEVINEINQKLNNLGYNGIEGVIQEVSNSLGKLPSS
jgi:hypothetical protein